MEIREAKTILEAVLFAMGTSVGIRSLAEAVGQDEEGNPIDVEDAIGQVDGAQKLRQQREREERMKNRYR